MYLHMYMYMHACMCTHDIAILNSTCTVPCHVGIEDSGWGPMLLARQALTETATTVTAHERLQK